WHNLAAVRTAWYCRSWSNEGGSVTDSAAAVFDPCRAVLVELPSGFRCTWNNL
ncbi:unnamed protein product, partial [Ectocarpus sp. 12 AP-2014]